jgi:hypothetical protein
MPTADLNSKAQTLIRAARKALRPAAGERERLEALLKARIGSGALEDRARFDQSQPRSLDAARLRDDYLLT